MSLSALLSETRCRSGEKAISAIAIIEMFIPCACDRGVEQTPLTSGWASTIHVAQGREMMPIVELPKRSLPVAAYVALTRTQRSESIIITGDFDFSVFSTGQPLNFRNELLLAKLRGNTQEYETLFARYLQQRSAKTSVAKRQAGEEGCRKRKSAGGENGDPNKKGGSRAQQQAAGQAGSRAGGVEQKRRAGEPVMSSRSARREESEGEHPGRRELQSPVGAAATAIRTS